MAFRFKNIVGVEISSSQIKMVEIDTSVSPSKVLNYAVIGLISDNDEQITEQIKEIINGYGFQTKNASAVVSGSAEHYLITLPPMPRKDANIVIQREVTKRTSFEDVDFSYQFIGTVIEKGIKKNEVLVATAPQREIERVASFLRECGLAPRIISTTPLALSNLLNLKKEGGIGTVAFVYLGAEVNHIVLISDGRFRSSREFILPPIEEENFSERLSAEITRTLFNFRQTGQEVERVILYGENRDIKLLAETLTERGIEAEVFNLDTFLDLTSLEEGRLMEFHEILPSLAIPIGAALEGWNRNSINFLSKKMGEGAEGERNFIKKLAISSAAAGLFFALVFGYIGLSRKVDNYQKILLEKKISNQKIQPMVEDYNKTQNELALHEARLALLSELTNRGSWWSSMFKKLALLTPDEMMLNSVEVNRKAKPSVSKANRVEDRWQTTIKGEVVASDLATAMSIFNQFYSEFRTSPFFTNVGVEPLKISNIGEVGAQTQTVSDSEFTTKPSASLVAPSSQEAGNVKQKKVEFEIKCELREQPIERILYKREE